MCGGKGRAEMVRQVRAKIDELGVSYIYYQFISVTGRIVGKGVPADHWESDRRARLPARLWLDRQSVLDRHSQYIGYGPEASELVGIPDPETFCSCPGTSGSRASSAPASATARRRTIPAAFSPRIAAAICG